MPRIKPTTTFTPRVKPTTIFTKPRDCVTIPLSFDSTQITFDSSMFTWDQTITSSTGCVETTYTRPRKQAILSFADGQQYHFADGTLANLAGGPKTNIIQTKYT